MKKSILIVMMCALLVLTGCAGKEEKKGRNNRETQVEKDAFQAKEYEGQWKSEEEGKEADYLTVKIYDASNTIEFEYTTISEAPDYRVASIKVSDVKLDKEGKGEFEFADDGWNHEGKGTIQLSKEGIKITISESKLSSEEEEDLWGIASGMFTQKLEEK